MPHIVLLGDSVFDNAPYVASGRDVTSTLRRHLPSGWQATLLAQDGAVLANVRDQAQSLPSDATHLFEGQVVPLLGRGAIKPVIDAVVPLAEAERGYELMEKDRTFGKVVLDLS